MADLTDSTIPPLERAARAVFRVTYTGPYGPEDEDKAWRTCLDEVRVVLKVLANPSDEMIEAVARVFDYTSGEHMGTSWQEFRREAREAIGAMVDVVLAEDRG